MILAIDPGPEQSAYVEWNPKTQMFHGKGIRDNVKLLETIETLAKTSPIDYHLVIEMVACYGMPVGKEIFETVLWTGQFKHAWGTNPFSFAYRKDIKIHLCNSMKAKDSNIRQALIDRFGAPGVKKNPGKLYGVSKDIWSAVAIAVYYGDIHGE